MHLCEEPPNTASYNLVEKLGSAEFYDTLTSWLFF